MINNFVFKIGIILGSGLDRILDQFPRKHEILPESQGVHKRSIYNAGTASTDLLVFCGRKHFYEGYDYTSINESIEYASEHGVKFMIITNAAGGLNRNFQVADLMLINSHINFNKNFKFERTGSNGSTFLAETFRSVCRKVKVKCHDGVYGCVQGPAYETNSEIKMMRKYQVDAVGMSTVPELIGSEARGIEVIGVSVITNILKENIAVSSDHTAVVEAADSASRSLFQVIGTLANELN